MITGFALSLARGLGEYGSVVFVSSNKPFDTEIAPRLIVACLEDFDYAEATAVAVVLLVISFTMLVVVNLLERWSKPLLWLARLRTWWLLSIRRGSPRSRDPLVVQWGLTLAAVLVIGVLIVIPVVNVFYQALAGGFSTYWHNLVGDPDTLHAILLTLTVAPVAVVANAIFGVAAAWAIARFRFPGRTLLTALIDLPFSVSPVVAGLMFVLLFGLQGYFGPWLRDHGIKIIFATPGLIIATSFVTMPFVARELIPVMEAIGAGRRDRGRQPGRERLADVLARDAPEHQMGPALWHHPVQRPGDGRVRRRVRRVGAHRRPHRNDAAPRRKAISGIQQRPRPLPSRRCSRCWRW